MPKLLFEIWHDPQDASFELGAVCEPLDDARSVLSPDAVLMHQFTAESGLDAFQQNHDFHGLGRYQLPEGESIHFYTQDEEDQQARYLATRNLEFEPPKES